MVGMLKEPVAVLQQVIHDHDVHEEDDENDPSEALFQFVKLEGNEKDRFADGQPTCPRNPTDEADTLG